MNTMRLLLALSVIALFTGLSEGGPLSALTSYGICQTGCNTIVVACYAGAGFVFGAASAGTAIPATLIACNSGLGACMTGCAVVTIGAAVTPTP